jgi:hypothetical protein
MPEKSSQRLNDAASFLLANSTSYMAMTPAGGSTDASAALFAGYAIEDHDGAHMALGRRGR